MVASLYGDRVMSRALPHANCQAASEKHVQQILHLVGDLKTKAFTNHYVPGGAKLLVHGFLDHLGCTLKWGRE